MICPSQTRTWFVFAKHSGRNLSRIPASFNSKLIFSIFNLNHGGYLLAVYFNVPLDLNVYNEVFYYNSTNAKQHFKNKFLSQSLKNIQYLSNTRLPCSLCPLMKYEILEYNKTTRSFKSHTGTRLHFYSISIFPSSAILLGISEKQKSPGVHLIRESASVLASVHSYASMCSQLPVHQVPQHCMCICLFVRHCIVTVYDARLSV